MSSKLEQELARLKPGDHLCLIYANKAEQMAAVVPFIVNGLARRGRCLYSADERTIEEIVEALAAAGLDVAGERKRGALRLVTSQESYLRNGVFVPQEMIDYLRQAEAEALADGFAGLWCTGEMTWVLGSQADGDRYLEYEALLNHFLAESKVVILCQYNYARFAAPSLHDVFRTHPLIILGDQICPNSYYETPEMVLSEDQAVTTSEYKARRVDWWTAQLKRARTAEQEREQTLERLQESERRLAEAQQVAQIGSWERDLRTDQVTWSAELYRLFGLPVQEGPITFQIFLHLVFPEDQERIHREVKEVVAQGRPFNCDYRIRRADGSMRTINDRGSIIRNEEGEPIRLVGTAQDVTELRRAEQSLQEYAVRLQALSRRLLEVQEAERRHLARELHDEFGQILATITLHLHAARGLAGAAARSRLDECATLLQQAGEHVRSLALELRPSMLDTLGLEASLRWLAENYQQRTGLVVQVVGHLSGSQLPPTLAIACFRVVQEALTNVVRHAEARHVWIDLNQSDSVLELGVRDDGAGFEVATTQEQAIQRGRLGLLGMAERVQLFGGSLEIDSAPGRGTRIRISLPLHAVSERE